MQDEHNETRTWAHEAMATAFRWRDNTRSLFGSMRRNVAGLLTTYRGRPSGALIGGFLAFLGAAMATTFVMFPGARMRVWEGVGRYSGLRRPERPASRFRRWTRRVTVALGLGR